MPVLCRHCLRYVEMTTNESLQALLRVWVSFLVFYANNILQMSMYEKYIDHNSEHLKTTDSQYRELRN